MSLMACPYGFVIPADPDIESVQYANRTLSPCAYSCSNYPLYSKYQWNTLFIVGTLARFFSVVIVSLVLYSWLWKSRRQGGGLFLFVQGVAAVITYTLLFVLELFLGSPRSWKCTNNDASPVVGTGWSACYVEGVALTFLLLLNTCCYFAQSFDLFRKVVLGTRVTSTTSWVNWQLLLLFGYPTLCVCLLSDGIGYTLGREFCSSRSANSLLFNITYISMGVLYVLGLLLSLAVLGRIAVVKCMMTTAIARTQAGHLLIISLRFVIFYGVLFSALFAVTVMRNNAESDARDLLDIWGTCVLSSYDGSESSYSHCGQHPGGSGLYFYLIFTSNVHLLLSIAYLIVNWEVFSKWVRGKPLQVRGPENYEELPVPDTSMSAVLPAREAGADSASFWMTLSGKLRLRNDGGATVHPCTAAVDPVVAV